MIDKTSTDERFTPPEVWTPLNRLFNFDLDPCTTPDNPLATYYFFTKEDDGLTRPWAPEKVFVNPPYSDIGAWVDKAVGEAASGAFVAFLIPNDCSTVAFSTLKKWSWGRWEIPFRVKFRTPVVGEKKDVARSHVVFFLGGLR
jgi:phage N-6-adenine-methyltransferase